MNTFWWVVPTAHECLVTNVCAQKVSQSPCVHYCSLDCSREKMCGFFFLSVNLICSRPYWCQYMHMFVHIFHFFNSTSDYLHAFLPAVWLTKKPCKVWYCWKIKSKSNSRCLFVLFMIFTTFFLSPLLKNTEMCTNELKNTQSVLFDHKGKVHPCVCTTFY